MLKEVIEKGEIPKDIFTPKQLKEIKIGLPRISDLTWRHHQIPGKMQLVVSETHSVNHLGEISYREAELDEKFRMEVCR
ncbi:HNH endonuclease [Bacillus pseudomycoides]|nr:MULTISPECIES: HNH endonuclease [Bacillus]MCX2824483.1 HNH endonuclease [Bacillus sp. DHT2]MED4651227.1 HNH endonuclease [Bacillus pseudomycoides]